MKKGEWEVTTSFLRYYSDKHYIGEARNFAIDAYKGPINIRNQFNFDVTYAFSPRWIISLDVPYNFSRTTFIAWCRDPDPPRRFLSIQEPAGGVTLVARRFLGALRRAYEREHFRLPGARISTGNPMPRRSSTAGPCPWIFPCSPEMGLGNLFRPCRPFALFGDFRRTVWRLT